MHHPHVIHLYLRSLTSARQGGRQGVEAVGMGRFRGTGFIRLYDVLEQGSIIVSEHASPSRHSPILTKLDLGNALPQQLDGLVARDPLPHSYSIDLYGTKAILPYAAQGLGIYVALSTMALARNGS
jgi:hypothetical protein